MHEKRVIEMVLQFQMYDCTFDGCRFGLVDSENAPIKKPWRVVATSAALARELNNYIRSHPPGFKRSLAEGSKTKQKAYYPEAMC
jgi:hypothetical protein